MSSIIRSLRSSVRTPTLSRSLRTTTPSLAAHGYGHPVQPEDIASDKTEGKDSSQAAKSNSASGPAKGEKVEGMPTPNADASESAGDSSKPHYKCEGEGGGKEEPAKLVKPEDK